MTLASLVRAVAAALALTATAHAQTERAVDSVLGAELRRCRAISDSLARIVCYDAIALPQGAAGAPAAVGASSPDVAASGASSSSLGTAQPTRRAAMPAQAAMPGADPARGSGLAERTASPQAAQFIESRIVGDFDGWFPGAKLRLANGQVWEVVDGSTASYGATRDPKVRISRGLLDSFFMSIEGVSHAPRVKRVQ